MVTSQEKEQCKSWFIEIKLDNQTKRRHKTKGEFTQYTFFVRFRPFFYVLASP